MTRSDFKQEMVSIARDIKGKDFDAARERLAALLDKVRLLHEENVCERDELEVLSVQVMLAQISGDAEEEIRLARLCADRHTELARAHAMSAGTCYACAGMNLLESGDGHIDEGIDLVKKAMFLSGITGDPSGAVIKAAEMLQKFL